MSDSRVIFHLHCYQPPREDPWTGAVPSEPSAAPAHDWNQRVTDECYRPLRAARVLDERGSVLEARNLYRDISVDVGPTLHRWIAVHARDVDDAIREADRDAARIHDAHGSAIAQPYVHAILPLATERDRTTLVRWGIADFRRRFGRDPEGMWLPEAAVDVATLECLAAHDVRFTILGQHQAARVRDETGAWVAATGLLDTSRPYAARLPSGRTITICFYDGALSHAIAFDRDLLDDGGRLADAVAARARDLQGPALVVVATDGETFGHHHRFGEMALARALYDLAAMPGIAVGGLGAFLADHPAVDEVEVASPSAWSCAHGVERWRADCGDVTGGEPHWNQRWRAPLRDALDTLVGGAAECYAQAADEIVTDPWAVRDAYGEVIDAPLPDREAFVRRHTRSADPSPGTVARMLGLLELQRHVLFASSSCAWFFADCGGIETVLTLHHASRAVELARTLTGVDLGPDVARALAPMHSNDLEVGDGLHQWAAARDAAIRPEHVAAWWAALALVGVPLLRIGRVRVDTRDVRVAGTGSAVAAEVTITDEATSTTSTLVVTATAEDFRVAVEVAAADTAAADPEAFALVDLPYDARATVCGVWWRRMLAATEVPSVHAVRRLIDVTTAAGIRIDREDTDAVLLRLAPGVVRHALRAPVAGMRDLAFVVDALDAGLPARLRWTAQNALLDARDGTRPAMLDRGGTDVRARAWLDDFHRTADLLGVVAEGP